MKSLFFKKQFVLYLPKMLSAVPCVSSERTTPGRIAGLYVNLSLRYSVDVSKCDLKSFVLNLEYCKTVTLTVGVV